MTAVPGRPPRIPSSEAVTLPESVTWPSWANGHRGRASSRTMQLDWDDVTDAAEVAEVKAFCTSAVDAFRPPLPTAYRSSQRPEARRAPPTPWWRLAWRCVTDELAFFLNGRLPLKYYVEARREGLTRETREQVFRHFGFRARFVRRAGVS